MKLKLSALSLVVFLSACGGGGGGSDPAPDTTAPVVSGLAAKDVSGATVTLAATVTDNVGVTGYCFKTDATTPLASDACFQPSAHKTGVTLSAAATQRVWARDAAGNVSAGVRGPCSAAGYAASDLSTKKTVCMMTDKGEIVLELESANVKVAQTVDNFLKYVNSGFFSGTTFHRVISTFMIQGGGYTYASGSGYTKKPATFTPITLESPYSSATGLSNIRGTIAMARSTPNSATSEFFINVVDNLFLDGSSSASPGYAVFGRVISGMSNVEVIKSVPVQVQTGGSEISQPVAPVLIQWAYELK